MCVNNMNDLCKYLVINFCDINYCSIGSLGWDLKEAGVQNVTVKSVKFTGTQNGVRVKSWARASNGFVRDVVYQHLVMVDVQNPIIIDQNYCPGNVDCPHQVYIYLYSVDMKLIGFERLIYFN